METITVFLRQKAAIKQRDNFMNALYGMLVAYVVKTTSHKLFTGNGLKHRVSVVSSSSIHPALRVGLSN
jgi:hypothetical protein